MAHKEAAPPSTASGADRISALPDGVRELVLSFLPAHEAVRTTVLARSWRDLWMGSPALRITGWGNIFSFKQFVERLLRLHPCAAPAPLDSCHLDLNASDFRDGDSIVGNTMVYDYYEKMANNWIQQCAVRCQARVVRYCFSSCGRPLEILDLTLVSRHLIKLELAGVITTSSSIDLSGCPVLQELKAQDCYLEAKEILSPYLQHLRIAKCSFLQSPRTRICLPGLISLKLTECSGRAPFLERMPSLATATVTFHPYYCDDSCELCSIDVCGTDNCMGCRDYFYGPRTDPRNCLLLNGLSEATNLELSAGPEVVVFRRDLMLAHTFGKLKTLVLADWYLVDDVSAITWFLQHSPILQKLTLQISEVFDVAGFALVQVKNKRERSPRSGDE